jgi:4-hydroxy-tetrahydrodipicolinate synthase
MIVSGGRVNIMIKGSLVAIVTPMNEDGSLDLDSYRALIDWHVASGTAAIVAVGTTGESPTVDVQEHEQLIEVAVRHAAGRVPVIAGTGGNSTREAVELTRFARKVGAAASLQVVPYYNKPTQEGLYRHFMTLADRVDLPIVLYNIPGRTGITMSPVTVARLNEHRNIAAIKEATGSLDMASEIRSLCDIPILSGDDSLTVPLMSIGAAGVISVISNLVPRQVSRLTKLCLDGQFADARQLHHRLFPLMRAMFLDGNPAGIKHAMKHAGRDSGELRLPLWEASDSTRQTIEQRMKELELV